MSLRSEHEMSCKIDVEEEMLSDLYDWSLPRPFQDPRHLEKIEGSETSPQTWRMKEKMKTVSVALVICLNVGVDPPGIIKTQPCARLECWIDPGSFHSSQKALEQIGANLQKQYERWQPRARYKTSLDPTVDEVKKLCTSLRRNSKDERVLFHYNGHGVPQPTSNGEIWVFNKNYTQYIPLSIYDLQTWMSSPSIYVFDCSNAGLIIKSFHQFAEQHEKEYEEMCSKSTSATNCVAPNFSGCIQLGACSESQILPMSPDLPADLFTACLTTPIRVALRWFILQNKEKLVPKITLDMIEKVPGQLNDRRTMLGELNWIFTAITDTIAWNTLPRHLFQRLFRQDLLVASLFRNFLLAERIMRSYDCTPTSSPKLPLTSQHPMWSAWDFALDLCLLQLPSVLRDLERQEGGGGGGASGISPNVNGGGGTSAISSNVNGGGGGGGDNIPPHSSSSSSSSTYTPSPFFEEQLSAFQVWLDHGGEGRQAPEQLPIVLQVLLSQVHRVRALELLGRFLDLGWWAVNLALSVGIFPYVLKLLQSSARELRPLLVFIWAKILAVDHSCQSDLVRDTCHRYFISIVGDSSLPYEHRTMAVFVLTNIVRNYRLGQQAALQANLISTCLLALDEENKELRRWVCICLGLTWSEFSPARWCGVRDSAHDKISTLLSDSSPEVRGAAVFALGTFINCSTERTEHANAIDHGVAMTLVSKVGGEEGSPLVRQELVVALHNFILAFENNFIAFEQHNLLNSQLQSSPAGGTGGGMRRISSQTRMKILNSANPAATVTGAESHSLTNESMRRVLSSSSLSTSIFGAGGGSGGKGILSMSGIYGKVYSTMSSLERDPYPGVALLAKTVMDHVRNRARELLSSNNGPMNVSMLNKGLYGLPLPSPLISSALSTLSTTPPTSITPPPPSNSSSTSGVSTSSGITTSVTTSSGVTSSSSVTNGLGGGQQETSSSSNGSGDGKRDICPIVATKYVEWCWERFARPSAPGNPHGTGFNFSTRPSSYNMTDTQDPAHYYREWRYIRNTTVRRECFRRPKLFPGKIDELSFSSRSLPHSHASSTPNVSAASSPSSSAHNYYTHPTSPNPSIVKLHEYERLLLVSEGSTFSLYDYGETNRLLGKWENSNECRITSVDWINGHDESLVMIGGDDGSLRVWKPDFEKRKPKLISSWTALSELSLITKSSKSLGLLAKWDSERERLLATGDSKFVRIWDCRTELRIGDWATGHDTLVTSIDIHRAEPNIIVIGTEDGAVRLLDTRLPSPDCGVVTWRDFGESWIVSASLRYDRTIVGGSANGRVQFFDFRTRSSLKRVDFPNDITALSIHHHLPYFASGCLSHSVNVYGFKGQSAFLSNSIKDSFISGRMGTVTSLHFHPYKPLLATADSYSINLYKTPSWHNI